MLIGGVHIIDTNGILTLEKVKTICRLNKDVDKIANKYIENYNRCSILFSNSAPKKAPDEIKAEAYRHAELQLSLVQILHQENSCWSIFNREEKDLFKKAEQISRKLLSNNKYSGMRIFAMAYTDSLFWAQGYIDGILFFDFQAGSFWDNIHFLLPAIQQEYLKKRHLEKSDPHLVQDFFQTDQLDLMRKIFNETNPKELVALFEEMLSMNLFYNFPF